MISGGELKCGKVKDQSFISEQNQWRAPKDDSEREKVKTLSCETLNFHPPLYKRLDEVCSGYWKYDLLGTCDSSELSKRKNVPATFGIEKPLSPQSFEMMKALVNEVNPEKVEHLKRFNYVIPEGAAHLLGAQNLLYRDLLFLDDDQLKELSIAMFEALDPEVGYANWSDVMLKFVEVFYEPLELLRQQYPKAFSALAKEIVKLAIEGEKLSRSLSEHERIPDENENTTFQTEQAGSLHESFKQYVETYEKISTQSFSQEERERLVLPFLREKFFEALFRLDTSTKAQGAKTWYQLAKGPKGQGSRSTLMVAAKAQIEAAREIVEVKSLEKMAAETLVRARKKALDIGKGDWASLSEQEKYLFQTDASKEHEDNAVKEALDAGKKVRLLGNENNSGIMGRARELLALAESPLMERRGEVVALIDTITLGKELYQVEEYLKPAQAALKIVKDAKATCAKEEKPGRSELEKISFALARAENLAMNVVSRPKLFQGELFQKAEELITKRNAQQEITKEGRAYEVLLSCTIDPQLKTANTNYNAGKQCKSETDKKALEVKLVELGRAIALWKSVITSKQFSEKRLKNLKRQLKEAEELQRQCMGHLKRALQEEDLATIVAPIATSTTSTATTTAPAKPVAEVAPVKTSTPAASAATPKAPKKRGKPKKKPKKTESGWGAYLK